MADQLLDARFEATAGQVAFEVPPPFVARAPWWGGDLQTLRNFLLRRPPDLAAWPGLRLELPVRDGGADRLVATLHQPTEEAGRPLALLVHGLTGCQDSAYLRASARHLLGLGYPVVRLNLRGAGPSRPLCRRGYHAGSSRDLADALHALRELDARLIDRGLVLVGYSLGGNILLRFLAEAGRELPLRAAATVSAPIDLRAAALRLQARRNRPYQGYLLRRMRAEAAGGPEPPSAAERSLLRRIRTVYEFDERFIAPRNGFAGAEDYYRRCSARAVLEQIDVPVLLIHAGDDPWVPAAAYGEVDWVRLPKLLALRPARGGHAGFHGRDRQVPWHDRAIAGFFAPHSTL